MSDEIDHVMESAMPTLVKALKAGVDEGPKLEDVLNVQQPDPGNTPLVRIERVVRTYENQHLVKHVAEVYPIYEIKRELHLFVEYVRRNLEGVKREVQTLGRNCAEQEIKSVLPLVVAAAGPATQVPTAAFINGAQAPAHPGWWPPARLRDSINEFGTRSRLVVPSVIAGRIRSAHLVEKVTEWPGEERLMLLMRMAGGPTIERLVAQPRLVWRRVSDVRVRLVWTDEIRLMNADQARLFMLV